MHRASFLLGALHAQACISYDLWRSLLLPVVLPPGEPPELQRRPATITPTSPATPIPAPGTRHPAPDPRTPTIAPTAPDTPIPASGTRHPTPDPRIPTIAHRLRLISWNIHRGYNQQGVRHGLAKLLTNENPDLLLLQEVPIYPQAPFWQLDGIRELLNPYHLQYCPMHRVATPTTYYPFTQSGLVTLSKQQPTIAHAIPLPTVSRPKLGRNHTIRRVALYTRFTWESGTLAVVNLHLENTTGPKGRAIQIRHLLEELQRFEDPAVILAGDLNTFLGPWESVPGTLEREGYQQAPLAGASRITPRLDRVYLHGLTGSGRVLRISGSDHRPILADTKPSL